MKTNRWLLIKHFGGISEIVFEDFNREEVESNKRMRIEKIMDGPGTVYVVTKISIPGD